MAVVGLRKRPSGRCSGERRQAEMALNEWTVFPEGDEPLERAAPRPWQNAEIHEFFIKVGYNKQLWIIAS